VASEKKKSELLDEFFEGIFDEEHISIKLAEEPKKTSEKLTDEQILDSLKLKLPYTSEWAIRLVKYCEKGNSCEAFCGEYRVSPSQLQKWASENIEFEEAMKMARAAEIWYWEKQLSELLSSGGGEESDPDLMRICKFKLENLGYGSKLTEKSKVIFEDQSNKTQKQIKRFADTRKDAAITSEEELERMVDALYATNEPAQVPEASASQLDAPEDPGEGAWEEI
jgi:hypothetical protein